MIFWIQIVHAQGRTQVQAREEGGGTAPHAFWNLQKAP